MSNAVKVAVLIAIGGALYAADGFYTFYSEEQPQFEQQVTALENQVKTKERELKRLLTFAQNIANVKRELRELSIQFQTALEHMPANFDLAQLLRKLNQLALNSGVKLVDFAPDRQETRPPGAFYATTGIRFQIQGGFSESLVFFDQVTRMKRIINVNSLKFRAPNTQANRRNVSGTTPLALNAEITTYRFVE